MPLLALVAVALAALLLAACGSGESSGVDQFRDKTESGLLDFGEEGEDPEREQASRAVSAFLAARSAGDWETACKQLTSQLVDKLERLATTSTSLPDKSCASFLEEFVQLSPEELSEKSTGDSGLRRAGQRGFLIYLCAGEVVCAMPLEEDEGKWKVGAISAKRLS
jgi:hypothetical protein